MAPFWTTIPHARRQAPGWTLVLAMGATTLAASCDKSPPSPSPAATEPNTSDGRTPAAPEGGLSALIDAIDAESSAASDAPTAPTITEPDRPDRLLFLGLEAPISPLWQWQPTRSTSWLAEWVVPGTQGGEPAQLIIWIPKLDRAGMHTSAIPEWERQFRTGVLPTRAIVQERALYDLPVTLVELSGNYSGMGGGWHRPDFRQLTAIADGPKHTIGIRLLGPSTTVEAHRDAFMRMVEGLRRTN